jgi:hypothetical protein
LRKLGRHELALGGAFMKTPRAAGDLKDLPQGPNRDDGVGDLDLERDVSALVLATPRAYCRIIEKTACDKGLRVTARTGDTDTVFAILQARLRQAMSRVLSSARAALRDAFRPAPLAAGFVRDVLRSPDELLARCLDGRRRTF